MIHKLFTKSYLLQSAIALLMVISHYVKAQPIVVVWGDIDNPREIEARLNLVLNTLEVTEDIFVSVQFKGDMPSGLLGITLANECFCDYKKVIQVLIDSRRSLKKRNEVLIHEMIHVKQFTKGELQIVGWDKVKWHGRIFRNVNNKHNHEAMPWEIEAFKMTRPLTWILGDDAITLEDKAEL